MARPVGRGSAPRGGAPAPWGGRLIPRGDGSHHGADCRLRGADRWPQGAEARPLGQKAQRLYSSSYETSIPRIRHAEIATKAAVRISRPGMESQGEGASARMASGPSDMGTGQSDWR